MIALVFQKVERFWNFSGGRIQTFSSREQDILVSVSVSTVPLLLVTSITLQLFL